MLNNVRKFNFSAFIIMFRHNSRAIIFLYRVIENTKQISDSDNKQLRYHILSLFYHMQRKKNYIVTTLNEEMKISKNKNR